jgi:demethylmenaquinone methyltransferase/2-methoxy-6-polyprenyl-1,4-benzoquinol methylase
MERNASTLDPQLLDRDPQRIAQMFTEISPRYDLLNRVLSLGLDGGWRRAGVRLADPAGARRILDLATGTGDFAFDFLRHPGFEGEVIGLDFSAEMIARARAKARRRRVAARVEFRTGDALSIAEPDGRFDIVSVGFGVRNFADLRRGLAEAHRVLAPGGRLVVVDFFQRDESALVRLYMEEVLPRVGRIVSGSASAYRYLRESKKTFLSPDDFAAALDAAGFSPVVLRTLTGGIAHLAMGTKSAAA